MKASLLLVSILFCGVALALFEEQAIYPAFESLFNGGCGDGLVSNGEECDDFNRFDGDGCDHECKLEGLNEYAGASGVFRGKYWYADPEGTFVEGSARIELFLRVESDDIEEISIADILPGGALNLGFGRVSGARVEAGEQTVFDSPLYTAFVGLVSGQSDGFKQKRSASSSSSSSASSSDSSSSSSESSSDINPLLCGNGVLDRGEECDYDDDGCTDCQVDAGYFCINYQYEVAVLAQGIGYVFGADGPAESSEFFGLAGQNRFTESCVSNAFAVQAYPSPLILLGAFADIFANLNDFEVTPAQASRAISQLRETRDGACWQISSENQCLDSNEVDGDGCDSECQIERGADCYTVAGYASIASDQNGEDPSNGPEQFQGNGIALLVSNQCADEDYADAVNGNKRNAKSKSSSSDRSSKAGKSSRNSRPGKVNVASQSSSSSSSAYEGDCGNGLVEGAEECDDGNTINGDGCNASCRIQADYTCENVDLVILASTFGDLPVFYDEASTIEIKVSAGISQCIPADEFSDGIFQ